MSHSNEYAYELKVRGQQFMTGDRDSMGVIFNNLSGRNFDAKENPPAAHRLWLANMEQQYDTALPFLGDIKLISPDGVLRQWGCIGDGLPRHDPEVGEGYLVKTYPPGASPVWYRTTLSRHAPATSATRERFFFRANLGEFVVLREELMDRVLPVQLLKHFHG